MIIIYHYHWAIVTITIIIIITVIIIFMIIIIIITDIIISIIIAIIIIVTIIGGTHASDVFNCINERLLMFVFSMFICFFVFTKQMHFLLLLLWNWQKYVVIAPKL